MKKKIILRADGNSVIGLGHVYRLLALADVLKDDFYLAFAISAPDQFLADTINSYGAELIAVPAIHYSLPSEKAENSEIPFDLELEGNEMVVLDGYWFGSAYQEAVKNTGAKLICIDDFASQHFYADAVINHAPGLRASQFKGEPYTRYYLGLDYAMLRQDFFGPFRNKKKPGSVIISLGGSDRYQLTEKILNAALSSKEFSEIHILVSSSFPSDIVSKLQGQGGMGLPLVLHKNLSASTLVELMDSCTYAIVSASTVLLESYFRGMICLTGYYTSNQLLIYKGFVNENRAIGLGDFNKFEGHSKLDTSMAKSLSVVNEPMNTSANLKSIFTALC